MTRSLLFEAYALLQVAANRMDDTLSALHEKREDLDRESARRGKRMRADLERVELLSKGSQARAVRVEKENRILHKRLTEKGLGVVAQDQVALGVFVDRLF